MNIKLDCYVSRPEGKRGYFIERESQILEEHLVKVNRNESMKKLIIENITDGIRHVKNLVAHEDVLSIIIQNRNVAEWIVNRNESRYRDFVPQIDELFDVLEELDCRYTIVFNSNSMARKFVKNSFEFDKVAAESIEDVFSEFDAE